MGGGCRCVGVRAAERGCRVGDGSAWVLGQQPMSRPAGASLGCNLVTYCLGADPSLGLARMGTVLGI